MDLELKFHPNLYLGESINVKKLDKIMKKLKSRPLFAGVFVVTLSKNPSDQLELYDAKQLVQSYYRKNPPYIVGVAGDNQEGIALIERIVTECLNARGDCALKEYLKC